MPLAKEGTREMLIGTIVLVLIAVGLSFLHWSMIVIPLAVWIWLISFFRDPKREGRFAENELCAPADGTITEITNLGDDGEQSHWCEVLGGPAVKVGIFLSIFNVHANRAPCNGTISQITYKPGKFLDARDPNSGELNESNTMVLDTEQTMPGPIVVRQVSGLIARRIICHPKEGDSLARGERYGMIKFGSRTELIIPRLSGTQVVVKVGDKVQAGLTVMARQTIIRD